MVEFPRRFKESPWFWAYEIERYGRDTFNEMLHLIGAGHPFLVEAGPLAQVGDMNADESPVDMAWELEW